MKGLSFLLFVLALKGLLLGKFFKQKTFDIFTFVKIIFKACELTLK